MRLLLPILFVFLADVASAELCDQAGDGTGLGNAASNLEAGQWCEMSVEFGGSYTSFWDGAASCNSSTALLCGASSGKRHIITYANNMPWNPVRKELHYNAYTHGGGEQKHIVYEDATNTWSTTTPSPASYGHGYEHNTIDPATGDFFHRAYNSNDIYRWDGARWSIYNNSWETASGVKPGCCGAIAWFPERNSLMAILNSYPLMELPKGTMQWRLVTNDDAKPSRGTLIAVGGVTMLFSDNGSAIRYNSNGTLTSTQAAPCGGNGTSTPAGIAADHLGKKIIFHCPNQRWWEYDPIDNTTRQLTNSMPPIADDETADCINGGISTYGVIAYVCASTGSSGSMYIYKHSSGTPSDPPAAVVPAAPTDLSAGQ